MAVDDGSNLKRLEIKKYPNRRYYDATQSRHLTLDEIRSLVQQGYDIHVIDARSSQDITALVLTQIILELDTPKVDSLPVPLLLRLIRMNDQLTKDFIEKYFNQALKSFLDYQQQVEEQIRRTHGLPSLFPSVSAWTKAMLEPFAQSLGTASNQQAPPPGAPPGSPEVEALRRTVQKLQARLAASKRPRRRQTASRPKIRAKK